MTLNKFLALAALFLLGLAALLFAVAPPDKSLAGIIVSYGMTWFLALICYAAIKCAREEGQWNAQHTDNGRWRKRDRAIQAVFLTFFPAVLGGWLALTYVDLIVVEIMWR